MGEQSLLQRLLFLDARLHLLRRLTKSRSNRERGRRIKLLGDGDIVREGCDGLVLSGSFQPQRIFPGLRVEINSGDRVPAMAAAVEAKREFAVRPCSLQSGERARRGHAKQNWRTIHQSRRVDCYAPG